MDTNEAPQQVTLTLAEARAIYDLLDSLSGYNAANVFAWDGSDDQSDPGISGPAKIFRACGQRVPEGLP